MIKFANINLVEIENVKFTFVQELTPECGSDGLPKQFMLQSRYEKRETRRLNAHGYGLFCRFSIGLEWVGRSGAEHMLCSVVKNCCTLVSALTYNVVTTWGMEISHL